MGGHRRPGQRCRRNHRRNRSYHRSGTTGPPALHRRARPSRWIPSRCLGRYRAAGIVALLALLITAVDRAIERRRQVTAQRALGVPARTIRRSQLIQALLPLAIGVPMAGLAGLVACRSYLAIGKISVQRMPWGAIGTAVTLGAVAAVLVALATVPAIGGRLRPELLRQE